MREREIVPCVTSNLGCRVFLFLTENVTAHLNQSLFDETNSFIEFERPYRCNSAVFIPFVDNLNVTAYSFNTTLDVSHLRVQVFRFRKPGEFGVGKLVLSEYRKIFIQL